ncbi:hypothetical protein [Cochlodiniinecator piscidefendens]|uniref:hypothetical protein n=1 Tax=Cochlodiniinecator piscidefendens TaxID=2715756 RepID=UPI00140B6677|nr:hypothetical protein [Cochlodiniinecator piscidefendens]
MKKYLILAFALLAAAPASAECYADYKAKQESPLRLHYGVIQIPDSACSTSAAASVIAGRINAGGWQLLDVVSVFDSSGLASRSGEAGDYYLRY